MPDHEAEHQKVEPDWGFRLRWPAKGRERAYAGLQRIHKKVLHGYYLNIQVFSRAGDSKVL